jgi:hypothetical protein
MKTRLLVILICVISLKYSQGQILGETAKQVYNAPNLSEVLRTHNNVAIIPFKVTIGYKRLPKGFDAEGNRLEEQKMGMNLQQGMYTYLLRKSSDYFVTFQDVERTNALLRKAGLLDKLDETLNDELCKVLGVDAVIKCNYAYEKTGSEAGSIAMALAFGVASNTGNGGLTMQIYEAQQGQLLWRFYKAMNETGFSSGTELMERMMRKVARNFPYMNQ